MRRFHLVDTQAARGWAARRGPFLALSYRGGPDSALAETGTGLGDAIGCRLSIPGRGEAMLPTVYDPESDRYCIELWGRDQSTVGGALGARGEAAVASGRLLGRPDLVSGGPTDFERMAVDGRDLRGVSAGHTMHPILPLYLDVTWTARPDGGGATDGPHRLGFEMLLRGWDNYLSGGFSGNPHGGVGTEYRTLLSNYGAYAGSGELARVLEPHNLNAHGTQPVLYVYNHTCEGGVGGPTLAFRGLASGGSLAAPAVHRFALAEAAQAHAAIERGELAGRALLCG